MVQYLTMTLPEYEPFIRSRFGTDADMVLSNYPATSPQELKISLERIMTKYDFTDAAIFVAGYMSDLNRKTYLYRFSYSMPGQPLGASHGSELFMMFGYSKIPLDAQSLQVSEMMMDLWVRFVQTGDPNGKNSVVWPQYSREEERYLDIGLNPVEKRGYEESS